MIKLISTEILEVHKIKHNKRYEIIFRRNTIFIRRHFIQTA